jgi:hypothetical protein
MFSLPGNVIEQLGIVPSMKQEDFPIDLQS